MGTERKLANATAPGIAPAYSLNGSPVQGVGGVTHTVGNIQPAGLHSTAPYVPPKRRHRDNPEKLLCSFEGCRAYPTKKHPYCAGHSKSLGLVDWDNTPKGKRKGKDDDTGGTAAVGSTADGDDGS